MIKSCCRSPIKNLKNSPVSKLFPARAFASLQGLSIKWWLILGAFLLLWRLDYAGLWNPDEARYAAAAYEMAHPFGGEADWLVPHLNSIPRLNKPPLVYWLGAVSIHLFGINETKLAVRRGGYLRKYVYAFIESFAPTLTQDVIEQALAQADVAAEP